MAPPPYQPIPYYETKPYTSGDSYQQYRYIPNDAYWLLQPADFLFLF